MRTSLLTGLCLTDLSGEVGSLLGESDILLGLGGNTTEESSPSLRKAAIFYILAFLISIR
jgi:hypothetical protein